MELVWIDDFIALDETRNFTNAAEQRHTTQPAFSRRIKNMEIWIGSPLFNRDTRPVTLTKAGKACKKRIYRLREDIMDMKRISNLATTNLSDDATIIYTTNTIAIGLLPQWLKQSNFVNYRLVVSSVSHALETVKKGKCNFAVLPRFSNFDDEVYKNANIIHKDHLVFMCARGKDYKITKKRLSGDIVMYSPKTAFGQAIEMEMANRGIKLATPPICESASAEAILAQVKSGLGCGWVVESLLNDSDKPFIDRRMPKIPFDVCLIKQS